MYIIHRRVHIAVASFEASELAIRVSLLLGVLQEVLLLGIAVGIAMQVAAALLRPREPNTPLIKE